MFASLELSGRAIIRKNYPESLSKFTNSKKAIHSISGDIMFPKKDESLFNDFKQGLSNIKKNGTYLKILKKYYFEQKIPSELLN
jgi:ABC-type amino acid transport substrate-binding protein